MKKLFLLILLYIIWFSSALKAQEDIFDDLLREEVEVIDPQYKPVIGLGLGLFNFFGEISNNYYSPLMGNLGAKINVATYIDSRNRYFRANFFLLYGTLSGENRNYKDDEIKYSNFNFRSNIINFGINVNYSFGHFYQQSKFITPVISLGLMSVQFNSKADLFYLDENVKKEYNYWSDGTIRNLPESDENIGSSKIIHRDYIYETDLRDEKDFGLGKYTQNAFAIPLEFGLDFKVSQRVTLRVANSLNFLLSDRVDHVSHENTVTGMIGDKKNDLFNFTYMTLHLDLFSDPKTIIIDKLFAEVDFDYTMFDDEDYDMIMDGWDECPGTPRGIKVDSVGCPFDSDNDGVPNYRDKELNTPSNVYVDQDGIQLTEEELIALLGRRDNAVDRKDIDLYIRKIMGYSNYFGSTYQEIPDKFKQLDLDGDLYISFDEILNAIDNFFDFESDLSPEDIYELNSFFFSQ
ncbi:MAG: hypothetical protein ACOCUT_02060 [bacterium]